MAKFKVGDRVNVNKYFVYMNARRGYYYLPQTGNGIYAIIGQSEAGFILDKQAYPGQDTETWDPVWFTLVEPKPKVKLLNRRKIK